MYLFNLLVNGQFNISFIIKIILRYKYLDLFFSDDVKVLNDLKKMLGSFKMESAYDVKNVSYSNYTKTFSGLLDYIFFTKEHLEVIQVKVLLLVKYLCLNVIIVYYF